MTDVKAIVKHDGRRVRVLGFTRAHEVFYLGRKVGKITADYAPSGWTYYPSSDRPNDTPSPLCRETPGRSLAEVKEKLATKLAARLDGDEWA